MRGGRAEYLLACERMPDSDASARDVRGRIAVPRCNGESAMSKSGKPSIVFAHGLWADGSCFQKLIPALQADGHEVMCSQHGLNSLAGDVACVTRCFGRVSGPLVWSAIPMAAR